MARFFAVFAVLTALPGIAHAAETHCTLPAVAPVPKAYGATEKDPAKVLRSRVFTLAASWGPQYCTTGEGMGGTFDRSFQCAAANRFGFTLHGLWPDGDGKNWPQYCRPAQLLRPDTVRANLCLTPSADLLQHEWAKHGTCEWRTPEAYFADARALYSRLRFPDMHALSKRDGLTSGAFVKALVAANRPLFGPEAVRVALNKQGWLLEVRFCLDARRRFARCVDRPDQDDRAMKIRPVG